MPASTDTGVPLSQRAKFGIFVPPSFSPTNGTYHGAEALLGVVSPIAGIFCSFDTTWDDHTGTSHQLQWDDFASSATPRILQIAWQPSKTSGTVNLAQISSGTYDTHINQMLTGMNAYPGQVIVRFGHEMNGNWYKWSVGYTGANKGVSSVNDYIDAWRYIVNKARASGGNMAPNVKWLFCPNGQDVGGTTMEAYYPGDAYVDLLGLDSYNNYASDHAAGWTTPYQTFQPMYDRLDVLNSTYDMWIGETGCMDGVTGQSKATWFNQLFADTHFSRLKGITYFDALGGQDWRFQTSSASSAAAATGFQSVLGAVPYTGPPPPSFTIPSSTAYMLQISGETQPRYRMDVNGKFEWSDGSAASDTNLQRVGTNMIGTGSIRMNNVASSPSQQGNGPVLYGQNGALKITPTAGPAITVKRNLLDVYGLKAITLDPATATATGAPTAGVIYLARVRVDEAQSLAGVALFVVTAGSSLTTGNLVGLYDTSGNLLASSADQAANWVTTGYKAVSFSSSYSATPGSFWIALLTNGTTPPAIARGNISGSGGFVHNFNLVGSSSRFMNYGTSQTSLPSTITTGSVATSASLPFLLGIT